MTEHPGEQFPPAVDPDVEPGADPRTDEPTEPDYDSEPGPESMNSAGWVNPTLQARSHTDPLLAGFTMYGDPPPAADDFLAADDSEHAFEASLEEEPAAEVEEPFEEAEVAPEPVEAVMPSPAVMARPGPPSGGSQYQQAQYQPQPERVADEEGAHPLVEETMARLDELRERPVGEHAEVYADLHERLQSALVEADAEHGDRV
ncbi:hypothetical protein ACFPJ1_19600 [Kribbella qitaiheensis]|uniref:hypothetical protein n=1 Tax=Kribbella qitaiheensis TaxID=1544730 RepID=UPI0036122FA9